MKTKGEIKAKMLKEFSEGHRNGGPYWHEYYQCHIDHIDKVVEERIACLVNQVINNAIYAFNIENYNDSGVFGLDGDYTRELGLSIADLGDFPKNPNIENIDKFIILMNEQFEINMPTRKEYNNAKNEYLNNPNDNEKYIIFEEVKRRNGQRMHPSGTYGDRFREELTSSESPKKI